ncbi:MULTISPECIES: Hint domain-containing protein [unclassified Pseudoalteromonas]|uniref:Hint domain-containing protein n=1 Tax=unclassified Pseudoalteromonas TaxID=194690 RepID=UPI001F463E8A|nr:MULTISPECIES: Hint domain-containing protein [unclassified Pseudoalteromonas]MCF2827238.1 Hint domain-containing protein [Pseudoalteromonas sp. OF5H-5]MCF2834138.1 Hint domain-containing protein [Pseudoalteromonas sp. DL2-H6]MCF2926396.1 Hint domain-containing protein [Pseudoalteromonas sp. DL2-H1]
MKKLNKKVLMPLAIALAVSNAVAASNSVDQQATSASKQKSEPAAIQGTAVTQPDQFGIRKLDMSNPQHYQLAKSRLMKANRIESEFPQLHKTLDVAKGQHLSAKMNITTSAVPPVSETDVDIIKEAHFFLDMNLAISSDTNEPYLIVRAKSSRFGGTKATYIDLLLEDANGNQLAPLGSTFNVLDGKDTLATSTISLKSLKANFPDLDTIYASSYVELEQEDGTISTTMKYTEYPFSWEHFEALYGSTSPVAKGEASALSVGISSSLDTRPKYNATAPIDKNNDAVIKICLNRSHTDCDYAADQYREPNEITDVNIPFNGELRVPHEITEIYPTVGDLPNGIDEPTNIYLQEGIYGGATKQSYKGLENAVKQFSDYLEFEVDTVNQESIIRWNIPRSEGRFGNAKLFSNIAEANWYMTFAVKGYPYFKKGRGGAVAFQVSLTSETSTRFGNFYSEVLPMMKLGYSCLATGTMITMADGKQVAIEDIAKGDLVLGALASNTQVKEPMQVIDVSVGIEAIKMYRVKGADGSYILTTETHPISTSNKGIIWAKELKVGDRILTEDGSVLVTSVTKEKYRDKIYNLKLAPTADSKLAESRNFAMFANGMAVGDLATQDEFNYKDQDLRMSEEEILQRLPEKWKTDYINSLN